MNILFKEILIEDAEKLELLANWFDKEHSKGRWDGENGSNEVQCDLRRIARNLLKIAASER